MKTVLNVLGACALLLGVSSGWAAEAEEPAVMDVITIDTTNASEPYLATHKEFTELYRQKGSQGERSLWFNAWGGTNTGLAIVTIRYPNMAALAADGVLVRSSEYQAISQGFFEKGFRVQSRAIVIEQR